MTGTQSSKRLDIITVFPEMVMQVARYGVVGKAVERGLAEIAVWNPRDYAEDRHGTVDDRPYGGGPGMVMKAAPLRAAIRSARLADGRPARVIYLSPQGQRLDQQGVARLARHKRLILLCGRYEGIDERLIEAEVDEEVSIGDYVLSGGELPAMVVVDAIVRMIPGVLGHEDSAAEDSFATGLLDHPHYTRPDDFEGRTVPRVLRSGDHGAVEEWRLKQALGRTWLRRPELLSNRELEPRQQKLLDEFVAEYREIERSGSEAQEQRDKSDNQGDST
ncbi:tRNA (Guanine37-N1) -methyltransferase [Halorhodospira halochloris]|uniref:tRNA (guanine-N(1)-)-methyltransferase n=1 Tax=Halorhodospira halochloris TaxID=1052 RepID=A0A0X8XBE9_HALHR|nr:tRNA (guanosine(37)-N1)-methyltransferase TrmD [Halorhodospira halochloris]MBK1651784.1 tRNA (guanosine(37)-N1)-methyltransferase TrmD [Halorhodospira halochloris]BAU58881.2 tRNA (Guanine37-N1) -methyltransferase [Halorhodospira halochloris]